MSFPHTIFRKDVLNFSVVRLSAIFYLGKVETWKVASSFRISWFNPPNEIAPTRGRIQGNRNMLIPQPHPLEINNVQTHI